MPWTLEPVKCQIQTGGLDWHTAGRPQRPAASPQRGPTSRTAALGGTVTIAVRLRTTSPLARLITRPLSPPDTEATRVPVRTVAPTSVARECSPSDQRLPAAVDVPDVALEGEFQLLRRHASRQPFGVICIGADPEKREQEPRGVSLPPNSLRTHSDNGIPSQIMTFEPREGCQEPDQSRFFSQAEEP